MVRPRWHLRSSTGSNRLGHHWDQFVALWAALNLLWVCFDITYVPLRTFWLQRNLYPLPSAPLVLRLGFLPDITPFYDPVKGIEPHRETQAYLNAFDQMDHALLAGSPASDLRQRQVALTDQMIDDNPFLASGGSGTLEKIKNRLRERADQDSAKQSAELLLGDDWLRRQPWSEERLFWQQQVLPLVATNYWRSIDENGRPTDQFWRIDLLLFQSVFLADILLRAARLRRRLPGLSWGDALLRRWTDLPLLLPFWRWLRLIPVVERLQTSGLVNMEPLRAVISRAVVALLAVELFEVLALQLMDGAQGLIRSSQWPQRIRRLRSHQSVSINDERELVELLRIWGPLLLNEVGPRLAPQFQAVLAHALQQTLQSMVVPPGLRQLQLLMEVEQQLTQQLASGMVDSVMELSRGAGARLQRRDNRQIDLLRDCVDRFWDELAEALESGPVLERSQQLVCALLEELKLTYLAQINRTGIDALIRELDQLTVPPATAAENQPMGAEASGPASTPRDQSP
ncbi:hypothetical protein [Synechococcus sp. J7-Johnson]|uniref:hypothetical protein n=1 Tax=Synechococcus sp. J7-Johnson TaxID=2823737 RepID=UPI0020CF68B8|nr:hypothetical protein [Synechococcus sp. J7-Johnson]